ncbi:hypothetical protein SPRG_15800 [Saprolegnia parasitica CBS 223.65]|uniref:NAD/GMP synthase domain-containing protein n=1 Tax=Saprolegnia parasitica (strain CBS 223.65) TaxID=695850 RepID=A0A067BQ91_SAPPC|nr:hypothetical protein SPRG_15800 [Saprolegnia parasitica CBS 223.65]KDO18945.1 hypothetical protein SPRG_15800 [Saprolegnia parasitica CBS 223.65]|eukprot:XP_012210358.1 hypothetical protein SPRG_15800 [Saprolegnia parasitica CBS 223.65]
MWSAMVQHVAALGSRKTLNVVAFSGGVDSSVVAALVHEAFPTNSVACLGVSAALPSEQLALARKVATDIGIPLWETPTTEGADPLYIETKARAATTARPTCTRRSTTWRRMCTQRSCSALDERPLTASLCRRHRGSGHPRLFNGTNADDKLDPTRLGLVAASEFQVVSPLQDLTKSDVRALANERGLLNWNFAASPCLRSRLAFGVIATADHLQRVAAAEAFVRSFLRLAPQENLRVRFLPQNHAAIELDAARHSALSATETAILAAKCVELGFTETHVRAFRSGSVSGFASNVQVVHSTNKVVHSSTNPLPHMQT